MVVCYIVLIITVVTTEIPLVWSSKFEIHAMICCLTATGNIATEIYCKLVPVYSDNVTYLIVSKWR